MSVCRPAAWIVCLFLARTLCADVASGWAGDLQVPAVAGFERFARHGDLTQGVAGALLISELSCTGCHESPREDLRPKLGPRLDGVGNRLEPTWLLGYMRDIHQQNPWSTMPDLLHGMSTQDREHASQAIVAFLRSQQKPFVTVKGSGAVPVIHQFWNRGHRGRGKKLYHTIGCVACHEPDESYETVDAKVSAIDQMIEQLDPEELADLGLTREARTVRSIPHSRLTNKYSAQSLTMFLLDPAKTRAGERMPSFRLMPDEAADLAAYLMQRSDGDATIPPTGASDETQSSAVRQVDFGQEANAELIDQGRSLFQKVGCRACHETGEGKRENSTSALPLDQLSFDAESSCFHNPKSSMPRYSLDEKQVNAIRSALAALPETAPSSASELVRRHMLQLNCYACHQRESAVPGSSELALLGGVGRNRKPYFETVGQVDLGDEGRLPPPLTGVGAKLTPRSLASVFSAKSAKYRKYMKARMPAYHPSTVSSLLAQLPKADAASDASESEAFGEVVTKLDPHATVGRQLIGTGCVECHSFGGEALPGVVGIDLDGTTTRVRPDWFHRFVLNPGAVKHRTRMPTFFPDGKSNRPDLLDGDVRKQIGSIWVYLKDRARQPLPEKIEKVRAQNYELVPKDRPMVLRTFMSDAGTHAIAVGFPEGVHYAFDAERAALSLAWQGRFLDARGTWFERFTPPADPLGEKTIVFPKGAPFRVLGVGSDVPEPSEVTTRYQFRGYRLDEDGIPTLLYRSEQHEVQDRLEATSDTSFRRTWNIRAVGEPTAIEWMVHEAFDLISVDKQTLKGGGITVTVISSDATNGRIESGATGKRWLVELPAIESRKIEVQYSW